MHQDEVVHSTARVWGRPHEMGRHYHRAMTQLPLSTALSPLHKLGPVAKGTGLHAQQLYLSQAHNINR